MRARIGRTKYRAMMNYSNEKFVEMGTSTRNECDQFSIFHYFTMWVSTCHRPSLLRTNRSAHSRVSCRCLVRGFHSLSTSKKIWFGTIDGFLIVRNGARNASSERLLKIHHFFVNPAKNPFWICAAISTPRLSGSSELNWRLFKYRQKFLLNWIPTLSSIRQVYWARAQLKKKIRKPPRFELRIGESDVDIENVR